MSTFWDWVIHLSAYLNSGILSLVESIWLYPSVFAVALFDAIIPIFPSESVVIGSASAWQSVGSPNLFFLFIVAAAGAWCGDQTAYFIGTRVDVRTIKFFRRPKVLAALDWAEHSLEHRGALYIIAARFIPMGRVAVNLTAGALGYPHRRFMAIDAVATTIWAAWGILIGTVAASLLGHNLLLSIAVGVTGGVLLGLAVEKIMALFGLTAPEMPALTAERESREETASE
jgi:membrane protein DedA with SNARE-associated domain